MTIDASSMSWCSTASSVRSSAWRAISTPPRVWSSSSASCSRKAWRVSIAIPLAELAADVLLGALVARVREDRLGRRVLGELSIQHEGRPVRHARRLLHVVGDDHDRVLLLELEH